MQNIISSRPIAAALMGCMLLGIGPQGVLAQTLSQQAGSDRAIAFGGVRGEETITGNERVRGSGNSFFPGDHFARAFPGDHFTPREQSMLEAQGIRTIGDFIAADAVVIARLTGAPQRSVMGWQREISGKLR